MLNKKKILLVVSGGIAAYKALELIRRLRERGAAVRCVLTAGGSQFVTPLSLSALTEQKVYTDLWSLTDEAEMGHIQLSRDADLVLVAPASADLLAKMAAGLADDLATTVLLATDKPVLVAPAMNVRMWEHAATRANMATLRNRGIGQIGPDDGDMACGEFGPGRLAEPMDIVSAVERHFSGTGRLTGLRALVTSGPTHEPVDPVRYLANRSSGKQGHAIAAALAALGASTVLVTGPTGEPDPAGVTMVRVETARQMMDACRNALPADVAVCAAAVADWRPDRQAGTKIKKGDGPPPTLTLTANPDILAALSSPGADRPALVVGFAAETGAVVERARDKLARKGCDWIVANDVSTGSGTFGGDDNTVYLLRGETVESWPRLSKRQVGDRLAASIADRLAPSHTDDDS
ncbi:MAG: bifunctional phosphopantothenoylcysteine decarboxylase/phosphopantothenate--cysteine ligase CoaBC [Inquilinaceae bacterium]